MKTKTAFPSVMFLGGIFAGIVLTSLFAFTCFQDSGNPNEPAAPITPDQARQLVINHVKANSKLNLVVEALSIDTAQFTAMKSILEREPATAAFRVYLGLANGKDKVGIVVGMDASGKESMKNVVMTPLTHAGPCPTVCDKSSPIYYQQ